MANMNQAEMNFGGVTMELLDEGLYGQGWPEGFKKVPVFKIGRKHLGDPNTLSSVVRAINQEGGDYFDEHGYGAFLLRPDNLCIVKDFESMGISDQNLTISRSELKIKKTMGTTAFTYVRYGKGRNRQEIATFEKSVQEYMDDARDNFPDAADGGVTKVLDDFFKQRTKSFEYADNSNLGSVVVSHAKALDLNEFPSFIKEYDNLLMENEKIRIAEDTNVALNNVQLGVTTLMEGLSTPLFYIARSLTQFAWHKEDYGLGSIAVNYYANPGAYKLWFIIAPQDEMKFLKLFQSIYPEAFRIDCKNPLHHKIYMFDMRPFLDQIRCSIAIQEAGDIVVTRYNAIHGGINVGFTVNAAINYFYPDFVFKHVADKPKNPATGRRFGVLQQVPIEQRPFHCDVYPCSYHDHMLQDFSRMFVKNLTAVHPSVSHPKSGRPLEIWNWLYEIAIKRFNNDTGNRSRREREEKRVSHWQARDDDTDAQKRKLENEKDLKSKFKKVN